ncbi:MAG: fibronectin type III domain-containing protein, partial [Kiritimatiellae bacterium]|nr:fibronectin type III domain-containing protein [Kiritimatiellia bacterium]
MVKALNRSMVIAVSAVSALAANAAFRVTPYVQHPATDAMSLLWLTAESGTATIEWWPEGDAADKRTASVTPRRATELDYFGYSHARQYLPSLVPWQYRYRIEGLQPDTRYGYRVTLPGGETYSNSFRTSPAEFRPVRFVAYSDSETQPSSTGDRVAWEDYRLDHDTTPSASNRKYIIDQTDGYASNICTMVSREPDFYVIAGDLAEKGSDQTHWDEFWRHNAGGLNDPAGSTPILAAPGNHEYHGYYAA